MELDKKLFRSTDELVQFVLTTDLYTNGGIEDVEKFLGIEFEIGDTGVFPSDEGSMPDDEFFALHDNIEPNINSWRPMDGNNLPAKHPFIMVYVIKDERDRLGTISLALNEYVYPDSF